MSTFRTRSVEMFLASVMCLVGTIFALPGDTFGLPHYAQLRFWVAIFPGSEQSFGLLILLVGLIRWAALIINGYWSPTPAARLAGCVVGSVFWTSLSITFLATPLPGIPGALAWTLTAVVFEALSAVHAASDAFRMDTFGRRARQKERAGVRRAL
jgi:cytochrome b561